MVSLGLKFAGALAENITDQLHRIDGDVDLEDGGDLEPNLAGRPSPTVWLDQLLPDECWPGR